MGNPRSKLSRKILRLLCEIKNRPIQISIITFPFYDFELQYGLFAI